MLKQRIITALALLAVLLPALFADSPQPFLLLSILMIGAGAWEWGNMNGMSSRQAILSGVICVDLCVFAWWAGWTTSTDAWVWWMAGASWVGLTAWMLQRGVQGWTLWHRDLRWLLGLFMLWLAWLAMAQARTASVQLLLSIFCVVWAADVFAYFCGKALGGRIIHRKLAPTVSPGKSWEGAIGGLLGVFVLAWVWMQLEQTYQWRQVAPTATLRAAANPKALRVKLASPTYRPRLIASTTSIPDVTRPTTVYCPLRKYPGSNIMKNWLFALLGDWERAMPTMPRS